MFQLRDCFSRGKDSLPGEVVAQYNLSGNGKYPHCLTTIHDKEKTYVIGKDVDGSWAISTQNCPACGKMIVFLGPAIVGTDQAGNAYFRKFYNKWLVKPFGTLRPPASKGSSEGLER